MTKLSDRARFIPNMKIIGMNSYYYFYDSIGEGLFAG